MKLFGVKFVLELQELGNTMRKGKVTYKPASYNARTSEKLTCYLVDT